MILCSSLLQYSIFFAISSSTADGGDGGRALGVLGVSNVFTEVVVEGEFGGAKAAAADEDRRRVIVAGIVARRPEPAWLLSFYCLSRDSRVTFFPVNSTSR